MSAREMFSTSDTPSTTTPITRVPTVTILPRRRRDLRDDVTRFTELTISSRVCPERVTASEPDCTSPTVSRSAP
jgi:hypothetical protein